MTRRLLLPILLVAAVLPLTACFAPAPDPTPTEPPRPPSADGEWVVDRVVTSTFPEAEADGSVVGLEGTLYLLFTEEECTEDECSGTVLSGSTLEDRETNGAFGTYTNDESGISYTFETTYWSDCTSPDGALVSADAYFHDVVYTVTATDFADGEMVSFEGEGVRTYGVSDEAVAAGCAPFGGDIVYEITGLKSD